MKFLHDKEVLFKYRGPYKIGTALQWRKTTPPLLKLTQTLSQTLSLCQCCLVASFLLRYELMFMIRGVLGILWWSAFCLKYTTFQKIFIIKIKLYIFKSHSLPTICSALWTLKLSVLNTFPLFKNYSKPNVVVLIKSFSKTNLSQSLYLQSC